MFVSGPTPQEVVEYNLGKIRFKRAFKKVRRAVKKVRGTIAKKVVPKPIRKVARKVEKKAIRPVAKVARKVAPFVGAGVSMFTLTPWMAPVFLATSKTGRKFLKKAAPFVATSIAAIAGGPVLAGLVAKGAKVAVGKLGWEGGRLTNAPSEVLERLTDEGISPETATLEQVIGAAAQVGAISPTDVQQAVGAAQSAVQEAAQEAGASPEEAAAEARGEADIPPEVAARAGVKQVQQATVGGIGKVLPFVLIGGVVLVALTMGGAPKRR